MTQRAKPSLKQVQEALETALTKVGRADGALIKMGANERSLTHRLAVYLETQGDFPSWHIDCEYNRAGIELSKKLSRHGKKTRVFPDIIIHQRGALGRNLLAIEAKTRAKTVYKRDGWKLKQYREEHDYAHIAFVSFQPLASPCVRIVAASIHDSNRECGQGTGS